MISDHTQDLLTYSAKLTELSDRYAKSRYRYGELEADIDLVLSTKIKEYSEKKKNIGIEMAMIKLIAELPELKDTYKEMKIRFNEYKGLGILIEAQKSALMAIQSIMKFNSNQDTFIKDND